MVSYEFPPVTAFGGIGSYMYHLSLLLAQAGHHVTVFSAAPGAGEVIKNEKCHCQNFLIPANSNDAFRSAVLPVFETYLKANRVDVIESPEVGACALYIKQKFPGIPLVVKMHTPGVLITRVNNTYVPLHRKIRFVAGAILRGTLDAGYWSSSDRNQHSDEEYKVCRLADSLLSPSTALKNWAVAFWGMKTSDIQVVPNPFSPDERLFEFPVENRPLAISFVGKLSVLKGMKCLLKAIPLILKQHRNVKIYIVGRDEFENGKSMQSLIEDKLGSFKKQVVFTGALVKEDVNEVYRISRVNMVPSLWENYPTVVMEAMAAGSVVVASNAGGMGEMIEHNKTGLLFKSKDGVALAGAVNRLLDNEQERMNMAQAAREALRLRNDNATCNKDILNVYTRFDKVLSA